MMQDVDNSGELTLDEILAALEKQTVKVSSLSMS